MVSWLDHMVLTCADAAVTAAWYAWVLGVEAREQGGRWSVHFGQGRGAQKINLHQRGRELEPHAMEPTPGSGDLCFATEQPQGWWLEHLLREGVVIVEGPVGRGVRWSRSMYATRTARWWRSPVTGSRQNLRGHAGGLTCILKRLAR